MAKNLKSILKIFTIQRFDLREAFTNCLTLLNPDESTFSKEVINYDTSIRNSLLGMDSYGLTNNEVKILRELGNTWANIDQTRQAIALFMRQFSNQNVKVVLVRHETKSVYYAYLNRNYDQPINNDLHIFLDKEKYTDDSGFEIRSINQGIIKQISAYTPVTVDLIFYKSLTNNFSEYVTFTAYGFNVWNWQDGRGWDTESRPLTPEYISGFPLEKLKKFEDKNPQDNPNTIFNESASFFTDRAGSNLSTSYLDLINFQKNLTNIYYQGAQSSILFKVLEKKGVSYP